MKAHILIHCSKNKTSKIVAGILVAIVCFCWGCGVSETTPRELGYDYTPLETGRFVVYDVTEQQFPLNAPLVTRNYQLREIITGTYTDITSQMAFRIERQRRTSATQKWEVDSVWTARRETDRLIRNENGRDYIKLIFPPQERLVWNGNVFNNLGEDKYEFKNVNKAFKVGDQNFEQTVTVIQQADSTLVNQDKRTEIYAKGVGLIFRERVLLQFCSSTPACVGKAQIDFGSRQILRVRSYGKE